MSEVCRYGHGWIENTYINSSGYRECRTCKNLRNVKYKISNRQKILDYDKKYKRKVRTTFMGDLKYRARRALKNAVYRGYIKRQPCEICGELKSHGHHYLGYEKENWRKVKWLCAIHHAQAERSTNVGI